jgi:hypothetical protein
MFAKMLRWVALIVVIVALILWAATGANRGWSKTSVPIKRTDEVTGITVEDYQKRFVPGLDFLGAALIGGAFLVGISLLCKRKPTTV